MLFMCLWHYWIARFQVCVKSDNITPFWENNGFALTGSSIIFPEWCDTRLLSLSYEVIGKLGLLRATWDGYCERRRITYVISFVNFARLNFIWWWDFGTNSDLMLSSLPLSAVTVRHKSPCVLPLSYARAFTAIAPVIVYSFYYSFSTFPDISGRYMCFLSLNDCRWIHV